MHPTSYRISTRALNGKNEESLCLLAAALHPGFQSITTTGPSVGIDPRESGRLCHRLAADSCRSNPPRVPLILIHEACLACVFSVLATPLLLALLLFDKSISGASKQTMLSRPIWLVGLAALGVRAQDETGTGTDVATTATATGDDDTSSTSSGTSSETGSDYQAFTFTNSDLSTISTTIPVSDFSGSEYTYVTRSGQQTVTSTAPKIYVSGDRTLTLNSENGTASATSDSQITRTTNTDELTRIGGNRTMTATGTTSAPSASNTAPCNNYPEFCDRKYSNITEVCAHNAAFAVPRNAGSNQELPILDQLNDGVRMRMFCTIALPPYQY